MANRGFAMKDPALTVGEGGGAGCQPWTIRQPPDTLSERVQKNSAGDYVALSGDADSLLQNHRVRGVAEFEDWDARRLTINQAFRGILLANGLTTFAALFRVAGGEVVRIVGSRSTARIVLTSATGPQAFYLKRHERPQVLDRIKPLLHLSWPILGARNEFEAILRFHAVGIPTMTPVAFGESQGLSLLLTQDLGTDLTLRDWVNEKTGQQADGQHEAAADGFSLKRRVIAHVAQIARKMHDCGLHHQDFYLNHLLWCGDPAGLDIRVIDLGRVCHSSRLTWRWVIKDLAQLDFSARNLACHDRLRFLRLYLGRPFRASDRWLIRQIICKSRNIASHTAKNGL